MRRIEQGGAVAPCGDGLAVPERLVEQHDEFDVGRGHRASRHHECVELD